MFEISKTNPRLSYFHRVLSLICLIFFCIFCPLDSAAQRSEIRFERLSLEQGLSQSGARCILQDKLGFLWIGTGDGLNKYDGYKFEVLSHSHENPRSISSNSISALYEDRMGVLWVGTFGGGLNQYVREKKEFIRWANEPGNPSSLIHNEVRAICEDSQGNLWIGTSQGLNHFNRERGEFSIWKNDPDDPQSLSHNFITVLLVDHFGILWIGTQSGLNSFFPEKKEFRRWQNQAGNSGSLSHNEILSIYEDSTGVLWIGTGEGLNQYDRKYDKFKHWANEPGNPSSLSHNVINAICEDHQGNLWIGTYGGGLNQFNQKEEKFIHWINRPGDPQSLSTNQVLSIYEDRAGILWVGTYAGGINRYDRTKGIFRHWTNEPGNKQSLSHNYVYSILEDSQGDLWIGTEGGGLNRVGFSNQGVSLPLFRQYQHDPGIPSSLSHNNVVSLLEDRSGVLWIGTSAGLNRLERQQEKFTRWVNEPENADSLSNDAILSIFEDSGENLWIGTRGGLNKFNRKDGTFVHWIHDPENLQSIGHDAVITIKEDKPGFLWIGTGGGGLNRFDQKTGTFTRWVNEPGNTASISSNEILSLHTDRSGALWIGTIGGGLNRFNPDQNTFTRYREINGLPNDVIYGILEDNSGNLWLSTNKGISRFNIESQIFRNYDHRDGLQINEFNQGAYFKGKNRLFFGGTQGLLDFSPEKITDNLDIPPIVITTFKILDRVLQNDISDTAEIELSYKEKYFTFEFVALDYRNSEKNQYAYMIEGYDKDWTYSGTRRFATYTNLPPGKHRFRVKGSNNDGIWNEIGTSLNITIFPPIWNTFGFKIFFILFLLGMAYLGHKVKLRKSEAEKKKLETMVQKRTRELGHKNSQLTSALKELQETQSQLAQSEKMASLGNLAAGVAHEINNPVGALNSAADTSRRSIEKIIDTIENSSDIHELKKDKKFGNALNILKNNNVVKTQASERMIKIIQSLKNFARLDKADFQETNIIEGIENTLTLMGHKFMQRISIIKEYEEIPYIFCYPNQLNQVFMNIFTNASEAIKAEGTLTIRTSRLEGNIIIQISDTGMGIKPENLDKIFNPGYTTKGVGVGTGLGLSISYRIIKAHNGNIAVKSELGKGTDVFLTLPIKQEMDPQEDKG